MVAYVKYDDDNEAADSRKASVSVGGVGDPQYTFKVEARKQTIEELVFILNVIHNSGLTRNQLECALRGATQIVGASQRDDHPLLRGTSPEKHLGLAAICDDVPDR